MDGRDVVGETAGIDGGGVKNVTAKPDRPAASEPKRATAKLPQKPEVEGATAKSKADDFAVDFFDEDDEIFSDADFFAVDKVDSKIWRIEKRYYDKQDGATMLYYNYRKRKGKKDKKTGKRINQYRSGGKRVIS